MLQTITEAVSVGALRVGDDGVRQNCGQSPDRRGDVFDIREGGQQGHTAVFGGGRGEDANCGWIAYGARAGTSTGEGV